MSAHCTLHNQQGERAQKLKAPHCRPLVVVVVVLEAPSAHDYISFAVHFCASVDMAAVPLPLVEPSMWSDDDDLRDLPNLGDDVLWTVIRSVKRSILRGSLLRLPFLNGRGGEELHDSLRGADGYVYVC
jgi:hypothetical protein